MMQRIVLAYSGGIETSAAVAWLAATYGAEVVAVTLDLGQGAALEEVRDRALAAGAARAHVLDVREQFARDYVLPALAADAVDRNGCPMGAALARPLIASKLVEIAAMEHADAVAHGCTGNVRHRLNLEGAVQALGLPLAVLAPVHTWGMTRLEVVAYARAHGVSTSARLDGSGSASLNLWSRSLEWSSADPLEGPDGPFVLTRGLADCPTEPASVELAFEAGAPTAINGVTMPFVELVASLGIIAGAHGVGRIVGTDDSLATPGSRAICEAPAAVVLHAAHRELQRMVTSRAARRFSRLVSVQYRDVIATGQWFTPLREALAAYVEKIQPRVTGTIRLELYKGGCRVVGRHSPFGPGDKGAAANELPEGAGFPPAIAARNA